MDQQFDFRALLLKLQDCLSDNDRRRLHFIVGDTIPRYLRDDPTLGGTLSLLESLFDQAKISEQDFDYLIHAFNEIHCYAAVKRLKEHQLYQYKRNRTGTITTNVSDLFDDNEDDKINTKDISPKFQFDSSQPRESTSSDSTTISLDQPNMYKNKLPLTKTPIQTENKESKMDIASLKQSLKSRLTVCQLILFILNVVCIVILIVLIVVLIKPQSFFSDSLQVKTGVLYGNAVGGTDFNDAQDANLTFNDQIVSVSAGWTSTVLDSVTFVYSNGASMQHGAQPSRLSPYTSKLVLYPKESINGATIYTGTRIINNPYAPNGSSLLVVGVRFYTNQGRQSDLFGSSNATEINENFLNFTLGYVRGKAQGYVDALQFIWYSWVSKSSSAVLTAY